MNNSVNIKEYYTTLKFTEQATIFVNNKLSKMKDTQKKEIKEENKKVIKSPLLNKTIIYIIHLHYPKFLKVVWNRVRLLIPTNHRNILVSNCRTTYN